MVFLKIRKILIDVVDAQDPFISVFVDKIITDAEGNTIQTIGNFGRLYRKASEIPVQPVGTIADDGVINSLELFTIVATTAVMWIIMHWGGIPYQNMVLLEE